MIEATERKDIINEIYPFHINFRLSSIYYGVILRSLISFTLLVHSVYSPGTFVGAKHLYKLLSDRHRRTEPPPRHLSPLFEFLCTPISLFEALVSPRDMAAYSKADGLLRCSHRRRTGGGRGKFRWLSFSGGGEVLHPKDLAILTL